ncbi:hypothetical protein [Streptomyces drozdowiczii]|uniref:hypothetical protein n=1 Tax=Streptomyces drozdowiczii TaxID=202862 RepID=UPI00403CB930
MPDVQGRCPACGAASLFLGEGGHVTCARIDCPAPDTADMLLHGGETALVHALGGDRKARVIAHTLHFHGCSIFDVRRMTDEEFLAVPGVGETSLARIRHAFPAPPPKEPQRSPARAGDVLATLGRRIHETLAKGIDRDGYALAPSASAPRLRHDRVCLVKGCTGEYEDVTTWGSDLAIARRHHHGETSGRPTHPDGTPYRYHEIVAEGWEHCDGCRTWGRGWTAENPHDCPGTYVKGPSAEEAPRES